MSILYNDKSGATPQSILLAGNANTDQILNGTSKNAIANKAVYAALQDKIDKAVQDLVYYYTKSDVYNKAETRALLSTISSLDIKVVNSLPVSDISTTTIYFLKPIGSQNYDEYIYVDNAWVKIGDTSIDLSQYLEIDDFNVAIADYYTSAEVDALINSYYTKSQVDTLLAGKQDPLTFDNTPTAGSNNPVTSTGINTALGTKAGIDKAFIPRSRGQVSDMNDLLVMGSYTISPETTTVNVPEEDEWGLVEVFQPGNDPSTSSTTQVWYGLNGMNYSRTRGGSPLTWSKWRSFGGTATNILNLENIVADDPTVVDAATLVTYLYLNYGIQTPNKHQIYRVWVTAKPDDARYTDCGQYLSDKYNELSGGYVFSFAEFIFIRNGGNHIECQLRPWYNNTPSAYVTYWNSSGGWSSSAPLNQSSGWYLEGGHGIARLTTEDLNNVTKNGFYHSGSSVNCTTARHYPCPHAGNLEVQRVSANLIIQKYRPSPAWDSPVIFTRRYYNGAWSDWISSDYVVLASLSNQSITTSGLAMNVTRGTVDKCRELACRTYGKNVIPYYSYGAESGWESFTFPIPNSANKYQFYFNGSDSSTPCVLYLLNGSNTKIAGTIPGIQFLGKLGGITYPSINV